MQQTTEWDHASDSVTSRCMMQERSWMASIPFGTWGQVDAKVQSHFPSECSVCTQCDAMGIVVSYLNTSQSCREVPFLCRVEQEDLRKGHATECICKEAKDLATREQS